MGNIWFLPIIFMVLCVGIQDLVGARSARRHRQATKELTNSDDEPQHSPTPSTGTVKKDYEDSDSENNDISDDDESQYSTEDELSESDEESKSKISTETHQSLSSVGAGKYGNKGNEDYSEESEDSEEEENYSKGPVMLHGSKGRNGDGPENRAGSFGRYFVYVNCTSCRIQSKLIVKSHKGQSGPGGKQKFSTSDYSEEGGSSESGEDSYESGGSDGVMSGGGKGTEETKKESEATKSTNKIGADEESSEEEDEESTEIDEGSTKGPGIGGKENTEEDEESTEKTEKGDKESTEKPGVGDKESTEKPGIGDKEIELNRSTKKSLEEGTTIKIQKSLKFRKKLRRHRTRNRS